MQEGSYFSFIIGKFGFSGGFVFNDIKPPDKNIFIGYKKGKNKLKLLSFFSKKKLDIGQKVFLNNNSNKTVEWCWEKTGGICLIRLYKIILYRFSGSNCPEVI